MTTFPRIPAIKAFLFLAFAAAPGNAATLTISRDHCVRLVRHVPAADVTYRPGVDVRGNPVVPADLDGGAGIVLPKSFAIPLTVDLGRHLGIPLKDDGLKAEAQLGSIEYRDGQFWFGGKRLGGKGSAVLTEICRRRLNSAQ